MQGEARRHAAGPPTAPASYRETAPPPALRGIVECLWRGVSPPTSTPYRVLPDGCIDILFDLHATGSEGAFVVGTMTRPAFVPGDRGRDLVGARFRPGQIRRVLDFHAAELTDGRVALEELRPRGEVERLFAAIAAADDPVAALAAELARRRPDPRRDGVDLAIEAILQAPGPPSIAALTAEVGVTRQHLARRFRERVGVSPKRLARVTRFRRLLAALGRPRADGGAGDVDWASLAVELGYFDQSHLVHELRELAGTTPTAYLRERRSQP